MTPLPSASWLLLEAGGSVGTREALEWLRAPPAWVLLLVILPLVLFLVVSIYRRERISGARHRRWILGALRVVILLAVIAMLAEPVLRTTKLISQHSTIIVLVDDSMSMDIADKYSDTRLVSDIARFFKSTPETIEETTRYDIVRRLLRSEEIGLLESLRRKGNVVLFSFAGGLQRLAEFPRHEDGAPALPPEELEVLPPYDERRKSERVRQTRLSDALLDAVSSVRGGSFGASNLALPIVLLSDGQQTAGSRAPDDAARRLGQRGYPVYAVGVGNPDEARDLRIINLDANEVALAGDEVAFDAAVVADGFDGERVRVDLKFDDAVVDTRYVVIEGGGRRQTVRLEHRPPVPGDFLATVEVERRSGEIFTENNLASRPIRVLEEKIKVLYAEGPPRWEYRYLKNALIRDKTMEAQVFLFSADDEFIQESSPGVPPLRQFPRTREEIFAYHVVILGDVDIERELAAQKITNEQLELLRDFVHEGGGGLVFISGFHANPSKYLHTELYPMLPVEILESGISGTLDRDPITESFNVALTPVGREHAVMRLINDVERNAALWQNEDGQSEERLPGFYWFAEVGPEKKGAVVLGRHPRKVHRRDEDEQGLVIFAFMNCGKGRSFFSAVDNTWRWRAGVDNRYLYRFWGQVMRFCASGRLLGKTPRFSITTDKSRYALGETVNIESRVFDANMEPATEPSLTVYRVARARSAEAVERLELDLDLRGHGAYHGAIVADRAGLHDLWIGTETERLAFRTFEVEVPVLEMRDPRRDRATLEKIAALSGGKSLELHQIPELIEGLEAASHTQEGDIEDDAQWDELWVLLVLTGLLACEWILRRQVHLL
jgi:hypothetical protein